MIQVVYALSGLTPAYGCVAEYFVLEGATERGASMARRRLVSVYRQEVRLVSTEGGAECARNRREHRESWTIGAR